MNIWQDSNNADKTINSTTVRENTNTVKYYLDGKPEYYTQEELDKRKVMYLTIIKDLHENSKGNS